MQILLCNQTITLSLRLCLRLLVIFFVCFFSKLQALNVTDKEPSARLQLRSQQGGTTRCFSPPAEMMTFAGEQNDLTMGSHNILTES